MPRREEVLTRGSEPMLSYVHKETAMKLPDFNNHPIIKELYKQMGIEPTNQACEWCANGLDCPCESPFWSSDEPLPPHTSRKETP